MVTVCDGRCGLKRMALFIDLQNVGAKCIPGIIQRLSAWDVYVRRAYGIQLGQCQDVLRENGIMPIEVVPSKWRKNAADIALVVDLVEQLFSQDAADAYCIATADSDFTMVLLKIRERRRQVFLFGPSDTPKALRQAATTFYSLQPNDADDETRQRMQGLVSEFLTSVQEPRTVDAFARFVKQRDPEFSPRRFGSTTLTRLLRRVAVCSLRPVSNGAGLTQTYELVREVAVPRETGD
jgi:hypothetical protein